MERARAVEAALLPIEAELRRLGFWDVERPPDGEGGAFGNGAMSFEQWLRWVFVPNVRDRIAFGGPWPASSSVADKAHREWRMWGDVPDVDRLIDLLRAFDALFAGGDRRDG
jgi:uncharacterized protein YqcC (DUF446 family)